MHDLNPASYVEEMIDELLSDLTDDTDIVTNRHNNTQSTDKTDKDTPADIKKEDTSMDSISLKDECTIYEIAQIHQTIHDNWQDKKSLTLDVSAVTEVDAAFIQLLASCKKRAANNNQSFELLNPSDVLSNKIKAMYMTNYFNSDNTAVN